VTLFDLFVLATVQGLTEFLPVSSSGHLVLANQLLGLHEPGIVTEIVLHLGTLLAVVLYYRRDLLALVTGSARWIAGTRGERERTSVKMVLFLVLGTLPAVVAAYLGGDRLERMYEDPRRTSWEILVTGGVLLATLVARRGKRPLNALDALLIGVGQAVALFPGISRSGMTIAAGLFLGVRSEEAARFSFLLSIPAILGAGVLKIPAMLEHSHDSHGGMLAAGFMIAFVIGYASIAWLLSIVRQGRFGWFGAYCLLLGAVSLLVLR
jgi:undecaprenyl-diphosphatase